MIELLAPAGSLEKLKIAYLYGADAVYIGGYKYSLRANAINFSAEELKEAVSYAHNLNKKIYVTINIVFHNNDLMGLKEYLEELALLSVDAIIVSDIAVISIIKKHKIDLEIHLSTQASVLNYEAALFYKKMGVKRVVLARETTKKDIEYIKLQTNLDIECFIQGAMCCSFSGKCVLSNVTTNRDANRGGCAQVCRWAFELDKDKPNFSIMPKDLNMAIYLPEMLKIGVNSFKIEGRMRSIYYIATVVFEYRNLIDKLLMNNLSIKDIKYANDIINRCANRDSVPQFFMAEPTNTEQYYLGRIEESNQDFLGLIIDKKNGMLLVEQRNYFKIGDVVEVFGPKYNAHTFIINEIYSEEMEKIEVARHPKMRVYLALDMNIPLMSMIRLKSIDKNVYL